MVVLLLAELPRVTQQQSACVKGKDIVSNLLKNVLELPIQQV